MPDKKIPRAGKGAGIGGECVPSEFDTDTISVLPPLCNPHFDGRTYDPALDGLRLSGQLRAVHDIMSDGRWHTLDELTAGVGGVATGVSTRLRDLRKERFGGYVIERSRVGGGVFAYRMAGRGSQS